jgi:MFS family permease
VNNEPVPPLLTVTGSTLVIADRTPRTPRPRGPYGRLFTAPGSLAFTLTGALGRLPVSMLGVATVVMVATLRGSYALAGAVSAAGLISTAVSLPFVGLLVDRHGQAKVAVPAAAASTAGAVALLLCAHYGAPDWTLFAGCALSSVRPSLGAMTRARWAELYRDDPAARHVANSVEQVIDELCFMAGPVLAIVLCTALFPEAGLLVSTVLFAAGTFFFAAQRRTEPPPARLAPSVAARRPVPGTAARGRGRGTVCLLAAFCCTGAVFGSMEVVTVAEVQRLGHSGTAGLILALQAGGSCVAGLAYGTLRPSGPARRRYVLCTTAMAALLVPLAMARSLGALAALLFVVGLATAPTMVTGMTVVQELVPDDRLNEGMTTVYTGLIVGISAGAAVGGAVLSYWVPVAAGAAAYVMAAVSAAGGSWGGGRR